jgi:hypothetical protein
MRFLLLQNEVTFDLSLYQEVLDQYGLLALLALILIPVLSRILWVQSQSQANQSQIEVLRENQYLKLVDDLREEKRSLIDELTIVKNRLDLALKELADLRLLLYKCTGLIPDEEKAKLNLEETLPLPTLNEIEKDTK